MSSLAVAISYPWMFQSSEAGEEDQSSSPASPAYLVEKAAVLAILTSPSNWLQQPPGGNRVSSWSGCSSLPAPIEGSIGK